MPIVTLTGMSLFGLMFAPVAVVTLIPIILGGVSAIEIGKHRIAAARHGWSYQYNSHERGTYKTVVTDGTAHAEPVSWETGGLFPWAHRSR